MTDAPLDLTEGEHAALVALLRRALDEARFPMAQRHAPLRAILDRLAGATSRATAADPLRAHGRRR